MNIVSRILDNGNLEITVPVVMRSMAGRKRIIAPDKPEGNESLMLALARGLRWQASSTRASSPTSGSWPAPWGRTRRRLPGRSA